MKEVIKKLLVENEEYIINLRRELHSIPETEFEEFKTAEVIKRELDKHGIYYEDKIAKTGIKAVINGAEAGKTVLLRADMDALPVEELNEVSYKSMHTGKMHACGHDGHMAVLLAAAFALNKVRDKLKGKVILIFQPAEEGEGGAKPMIDAGVLCGENVSMAFGLHVEPAFETGSVALKVGGVMASPDEFDLKIIGKGGHGGYREESIDPIYISSEITCRIIDFARDLSTKESPCVISVGVINGGSFYNVIPDYVSIKGTSRAVDFEKRNLLFEGIKKICRQVCDEHGADFELDFKFTYPPLINSENAIKVMEKVAKENEIKAIWFDQSFMGGEDFAYFAELIDSAYIYIGCRNEEKESIYPLHSARFNLDEDCLLIGAVMMCNGAVKALED